jgi:alkylation response protein AidB-like acyl-CoA dehydrogenase
MDFLFNEPQRKLRDGIRSLSEGLGARRSDPEGGTGPVDTALRRRLAEAGLWGAFKPSAFGGQDCAAMEVAIICEELARSAPLAALALAEHNMLSVRHLELSGDSNQKERWLAASAQAPALASWCPADGMSPSRQGPLPTRAAKRGKSWVLNGAKLALAIGGWADWTVVTAITEGSAGKGSISAFILEKGWPGVRREGLAGMNGSEGATGELLVLADVQVPADHMLGAEGAAGEQVRCVLDDARLCLAALSIGLAAGALEACLSGHRSESTAVSAALHQPEDMARLALTLNELEAARLMMYRAALIEGRPLQPREETRASCARAVDVALASVSLATRLAAKARGKLGLSSALERSAGVVSRWLRTQNALESV